MRKEIMIEIIAVSLVLLFVYTAFSKLVHFPLFEQQMFNQPLPEMLERVLIALIPTAEVLTGVLLIIPNTRGIGFFLSSFLMISFTVYIILILFGIFDRVPCSCGGVVQSLSWGEHLVFNLIFTGLSFTGLWLHHNSKKPFNKPIKE